MRSYSRSAGSLPDVTTRLSSLSPRTIKAFMLFWMSARASPRLFHAGAVRLSEQRRPMKHCHMRHRHRLLSVQRDEAAIIEEIPVRAVQRRTHRLLGGGQRLAVVVD